MSAVQPAPTFPDARPDNPTPDSQHQSSDIVLPVPLESSPKPKKTIEPKEYEYEEEVVYEYVEEPVFDNCYEYEEEVIYEYEYDDSNMSDVLPLAGVDSSRLSESDHLPIEGLQHKLSDALDALIPDASKPARALEPENQNISGMTIGDDLSETESTHTSEASESPKRLSDISPVGTLTRPITAGSPGSTFHTEPKSRLRLPRPPKTPLPDFVDAPIEDQRAFLEMLEGEEKQQKRMRRQSQRRLAAMKEEPEPSSLSRSEILAIANEQLQKKPKKNRLLNNPSILADVIDELTNMKVRAMRKGDYEKAKLIGEVITRLRRDFRMNERIGLHKERASHLDSRLKTVKGEISAIHSEWKKRKLHMKFELRDELAAMDEKHDEQMKELEEAWKSPATQRKYTKKSPGLLQALTIEKHMVLTGEFDRAQQMRKRNQRSEKREAASNYEAMEEAFQAARKQLLETQETERNELLNSQSNRREMFLRQRGHDLEVLDKRKHAVEGLIAGEGDYDRFVARKFRKSAEVVLPKTVTMSGGADIPVAGRGHESKVDTKEVNEFRAKTIATPLMLPPLKVKRLRRKRRKMTLDDDPPTRRRSEF